jgi:hypothetical protein
MKAEFSLCFLRTNLFSFDKGFPKAKIDTMMQDKDH